MFFSSFRPHRVFGLQQPSGLGWTLVISTVLCSHFCPTSRSVHPQDFTPPPMHAARNTDAKLMRRRPKMCCRRRADILRKKPNRTPRLFFICYTYVLSCLTLSVHSSRSSPSAPRRSVVVVVAAAGPAAGPAAVATADASSNVKDGKCDKKGRKIEK